MQGRRPVDHVARRVSHAVRQVGGLRPGEAVIELVRHSPPGRPRAHSPQSVQASVTNRGAIRHRLRNLPDVRSCSSTSARVKTVTCGLSRRRRKLISSPQDGGQSLGKYWWIRATLSAQVRSLLHQNRPRILLPPPRRQPSRRQCLRRSPGSVCRLPVWECPMLPSPQNSPSCRRRRAPCQTLRPFDRLSFRSSSVFSPNKLKRQPHQWQTPAVPHRRVRRPPRSPRPPRTVRRKRVSKTKRRKRSRS